MYDLPSHVSTPAIVRAAPDLVDRAQDLRVGKFKLSYREGAVPMGAFFRRSLVVNFADAASASSTSATNTYTSRNLGTPHPTRIMLVMVQNGGAANITSVTVAGVSATLLYRPGNNQTEPEWWTASVPTGTTGNVVITMASGAAGHNWAMYAVNNWSGTLDASISTTTAVANPSLSITGKAGGVILASCKNNGTTSISTKSNWQIEDYANTGTATAVTVLVGRTYCQTTGSRTLSVTTTDVSRMSLIAIS